MTDGLMLRLGMLGVIALVFLGIALVAALREARRAEREESVRSTGAVSVGPFRGPSVALVEWTEQSSDETSVATATFGLRRAA